MLSNSIEYLERSEWFKLTCCESLAFKVLAFWHKNKMLNVKMLNVNKRGCIQNAEQIWFIIVNIVVFIIIAYTRCNMFINIAYV